MHLVFLSTYLFSNLLLLSNLLTVKRHFVFYLLVGNVRELLTFIHVHECPLLFNPNPPLLLLILR